MVDISRVSIALSIITLLIGLWVKRPRPTRYLIFTSIGFFGIFLICSIFIHPLMGLISAGSFLLLVIYFFIGVDKFGIYAGIIVLGTSFVFGTALVISTIETIVGHAIF